MRALITGGGGQLACDLESLLGDHAHSYTHAELDITESESVDQVIGEVQPDVVFNCAAFHNVDQCEREPDRAWAVNVQAVQELAKQAPRLVHMSTNYVFDGRRAEPYTEWDAPSPRSVYSLTKLAGEYAALAYGERALVVRSGGLYGLRGSASKGGNFVQRMITRARQQGSLQIVDDQRLQPTFTADLAAALVEAVNADADGIVHLTAGDTCSWFEFTEAIMELANIHIPIEPTSTTIPSGGVDRPLNGVLASPRADQLGISRLRTWREALVDYMTQAALTTPVA